MKLTQGNCQASPFVHLQLHVGLQGIRKPIPRYYQSRYYQSTAHVVNRRGRLCTPDITNYFDNISYCVGAFTDIHVDVTGNFRQSKFNISYNKF